MRKFGPGTLGLPISFQFALITHILWSSQGGKINWKDPAKALTKLYPREEGEDADDAPAEAGSFFNLFEKEGDPYNVSWSVVLFVTRRCAKK